MSSSSTNIPICSFCNCPSSCSLGQGDLVSIQSPANTSPSIPLSHPSTSRSLEDIPVDKRTNFVLETGKFTAPVDSELFSVGFQSSSDVQTDGNLWIHERCLKWALADGEKHPDYELVRTAVLIAAQQKCSICDRYGASLACRTDGCVSKFHLPCAQSSGCFFSHTQLVLLCPSHLDSVVSSFGVESASCEACSEPGDVRGQLFCTNCDKHYHAECLMLESNRVVRAGWRCPDCKICQTCRQAGDDAEMIMCNVCDKGYHTFCLRNQSIPKDGWSCSSCLSLTKKNSSIKSMCSLCQNEISSKQNTRQCHLCQIRIHSTCHSVTDDYYDDDSTYICRSCSVSSSTVTLPMDEGDEDDEIQKEIYRSSSISKVNRFVSTSQKSSNSPAASPSSGISTRKRRSMDYSQQSSLEYTPGGGDSSEMNTPAASNNQQDAPFLFESLSSIKDESSEHSMDLPMASTIHMSAIKLEEEDQPNLAQPSRSVRTAVGQKSGKGKPACEISKKRARRALNNGHRRASSPQSSSTSAQISAANQARSNAAAASTSLRGRPPKVRKDMPAQSASVEETPTVPMNVLNTSTGSTGSTYAVGAVKRDDDEHHAVTVLCASDELYTLGQDMCVSCGSFGYDEEGRLISCTQCGQSYHPFCSGVNKLSKVILKQGWRCLDCTVCEGCGKPTDESRLLLCDDCDISYHTYCLQPPLDQVPKGNWKCQWCVRCLKCGSTTPGPAGSSCLWENNYTECAPCHSLVMCPVCTKPYRTDELIVQCTVCDQWLHGSCEHILSEDSTLSTAGDFICSLCRPTAGLASNNETPATGTSPKSSSPSDQAPLLVVAAANVQSSNAPAIAQPQLPTPKATKLDEGVYLTDTGLAQMKSVRVKPQPRKGPAANVVQANNTKAKRGGIANYIIGGIKRNNSNSIQDDEMTGNNAVGGGSGTSDDEGTKKTTATVPTAKATKGYNGIGGFHVKVRGQRRRQDAPSTTGDLGQEDNMHDEPSTNKRKRDRRPLKKKSILEEHMPPEMQEAFFGSDLTEKSRLMAQNHLPNAPMQLNDQIVLNTTANTNDYTIKLDHDTVNRFLIKKATKLALVVKEEQRQTPIIPVPPPLAALPPSAISAPDDENDMPSILDNEEFCNFVEYMMNSSKTTQDPMLPLLGGPTDIEDFLEFIDHPETHNELQAVDLLNNSNSASQNAAMVSVANSVQVIQPHQTTMINSTSSVHYPNNPQGPLQTPTSNLVVMATNVNDNSKQIINNLAREMMESTGLHTTNTASILSQPNMGNSNLIVKQEYHDPTLVQAQMLIPQPQTWPQQPQTMIRIPSMPSAAGLTPTSTTPTQDRSESAATEHSNLIERTREDEQLGANATMSNVLYCNANHPDLKQQFPDFNERFKQMKKIWRKVPTDAKQNYTQRARLNRTQRRALKSTSSQSSNTSKGTKRKNSAKQQLSEPEDNNNDGGAGSESRSSTPSSSTTNETTTVIVHPTEHQEHPTAHLYQQPRQMYSPGSGNLMVGTPNSAGSFHHQPYPPQQRPQQQQQQGYGTPVSAPGGYPAPQRFNFPPQQQQQQQQIPPNSGQPQQSQSSPYFEYAPSTPRPVPHQTPSSAESTPAHHPLNPNSTNPIRKSTSSSDGNTPYHHVSPMDETPSYYQQQSPYANQNQMKPQVQQQLLPRGMPPRPPQLMARFPNQEGTNFVRTPSSASAPGQPARFIFTSPSNQLPPQQQATHYVQYSQTPQGQHTVVVQQGTTESFQRMPESPVHQHIQQQQQQQGPHHQASPQFSPHHHPMTPNSQPHPMIMSQQPHHISPYSSQQQQQSMHHIHPQHSPTIVVQPPPQFSPSSVHHHQLTLNTTAGHQSPPIDPNKRQIQMQKPAQQLLVQHEPMSYDEQPMKTEPHDDSLNESTGSGKIRIDPCQSVPAHVLEQIDEVINDVAAGAGIIPQDLAQTTHPAPLIPVQLVSLTQSKLPTQHMITSHHPYGQQQSDWSNYQQQPTLNIAAMRGPPYPHYHGQAQQQQQQQQLQQQQHHDLLPATTNVINTAGVPQHEQQQIVAERISSILSSAPHEQQQQQQPPTTTISQASIQIKRAWTMNPHPANDNHYLASSATDPSISLEDLLERDFKDKQQQQQQQSATSSTEWPVERSIKTAANAPAQQAPLTLAHAVHLLQQAITHSLYQQSPPPELGGLVNVGRDNDFTTINATFNEEQFERYARWLKQRREINSLRIKADETNLADIKKKRNILLKKQKQSLCTPEEEQEMPRLSQQQTEYSRTLTSMRKEKKQFDELEQAFLVYKQSRLNALYPPKSSPPTVEPSSTDTIVRMMSMNTAPVTSVQMVQRSLSEQVPTMIYTAPTHQDEHDELPTDDQPSMSPTISNEVPQKSIGFSQPENQSTDSTLTSLHSSSSPSSSFLTPIPPSTTDPSFTSMEHQSMTSSPAHENENLPFEACRTSPTLTREHESISASTPIEPTIHLTASDPLEQ